jgi:probable RNA-binding protein EIF1AD
MSRRKVRNAADQTITPPDTLTSSQLIARVTKTQGKDLYTVETPDSTNLLVELTERFRATIFVRRGGYVLVDTKSANDRDNKIQGEIVNIVRDEKTWRKMSFWPSVFTPKAAMPDSDEEESIVGKMPPSDSEDD